MAARRPCARCGRRASASRRRSALTEPGRSTPYVTTRTEALLVDLYELTMAQAYVAEGMVQPAVFTLSFRTLPPGRGFMLACGLDDVLRYLESLRFDADALDRLRTLGRFDEAFLGWLADARFTGDVFAVPEGTPVFGDEPILEIAAPLPIAQLVESLVMNQMHVQMVIASKAARLVHAARGVPVVDFGMRRTHGVDAALKGARAAYVGGAAGTSNVLAGLAYGIPVRGTMAHSYVQAHDDEMEAFRAFARQVPDATLLVDTYDTLGGVDRVIALAREMGEAFRVRAIRLDSGDLGALAVAARERLDAAGLQQVRIFLSGGLDEAQIDALMRQGVPADGFGVGSDLAVSRDAPLLDLVYKMAEFRGAGRVKTSPGKQTLPGRKQVFRVEVDGRAVGDVIGRADEALGGRPLLRQVMRDGVRLPVGRESLETIRERAAAEVAKLPGWVRALEPRDREFPVSVSDGLARYRDTIIAGVGSETPAV